MKKYIFIILSIFIFTYELNSQVNYKGIVIDNEGNRILFPKLISLKTMEYWQADIDGKYDFIAQEGLAITINYIGFNRFDGLLSAIDTTIISPYNYDDGVQIIPSLWHYQHFNSPYGEFESRNEYLQKKIKWIELESFESRYKGEKYHSYQWTNDKRIIYDPELEIILLQNQNPDKRQQIVLHQIEKDLLKVFGSEIYLNELEPGWHELYINEIEKGLEFKKNDLAIGVIRKE